VSFRCASVVSRTWESTRQDSHPALQRGQHHVRSIQRMNKVGWECRSLLNTIDGSRCSRIRDVNRLQRHHDLLALRLAIRLHDRQSQRRRPHHRRHLFLPYPGFHRIRLGVGALGFEDLGETFFGNAFGDESLAQRLNQFWMALAPEKRSPMQRRTRWGISRTTEGARASPPALSRNVASVRIETWRTSRVFNNATTPSL
jgi:hypothetical protein